MLIFRQLFDTTSSTYTYLLGDSQTRHAVFIDPVFEQVRRDAALIHELGLSLKWTLDTHVHADHVTGAWLLKEHLGSQIAVARASGATGADRLLDEGDKIEFGSRHLEVRATPGHTAGCLTYVLDDQTMAFSGDCLLIRGCGRTDFQQGDPRHLYDSIHGKIFALPAACLLYPAHDYRGLTVTTVTEEQRFNPRLGGNISKDDFVGYMKHLGLPHPKQIELAVPANLRCGRPQHDQAPQSGPAWAQLRYSFAGLWEIAPQTLEEVASRVQTVDVRQPEEFFGPMGHIPGAKLLPLDQLEARASELSSAQPVVAVCRSGARSAQAVVILERAGFKDVANLAGGMLRWRAEGYPVEGGQE